MKLPFNSSISYHEATITLDGAATEIDISRLKFPTNAHKVVVYDQDGEHVIEHDGERWTYTRRETPSRIPGIVQTVGIWMALGAAALDMIWRRL